MSNQYHSLAASDFSQDWSDAGLITANDDWSGVPSAIGFRGDDIVSATGADPQTALSAGTEVVNVVAQSTAASTAGGVHEVGGANPTIALQGSGTADAPSIVLYMDASGRQNVTLSFTARELDTATANQPLAVQYRIGGTGDFVNLPGGFVADASNGAGQVTPVSVALPPAANNQGQVQIRIITTDAVGADSMIGLDDVRVVSSPASAAPSLSFAAASVSAAEGNSGTTPFTFTVTRSGDLSGAASAAYAVAASGADPVEGDDLAGPLSGTVSFAAGEASKAITVGVGGDTLFEGNETFTVTLSAPQGATIGSGSATGTVANDDAAPLTLISAIQGTPATQTNDGFGDLAGSPLRGQTVTVEAIVVGDFQDGDADAAHNLRGFYLQEEAADGDGNAASSEGVFVFEGNGITSRDVAEGDRVRVTGVVEESFGLTRINVSGAGGAVEVVQGGAVANVKPLAQSVDLPTAGVTLSQNADYQPDLEAYEGMLVTFPDKLTIIEQFQLDRFNEIKLFDAGGFTQAGPDGTVVTGERPFQFTQNNDPNQAAFDTYSRTVGARTVTYDDGLNTQNNPVGLLDGFGNYNTATAPRMGDTVTGLTGVLDYQFAGNAASGSTWRVRSVEDGSNSFEDANPRPQTPFAVEGGLKVASFNVLNFFTTLSGTTEAGQEPRGANNQAEFTRQLDKLVDAVLALDADILGLTEIENDFVADNGTPAIQVLVDALNAATAPGTYAFVDPGVDQVGGDAIAVAALYRPGVVRIAEGTKVALLDDGAPEAQAVITASNGSTTAIFNGAGTNRVPLAVTFEELASGEQLTVAVNHFKSKGSAGPAAGDADAGNGAGFSNETRLNAAKALDAWLEGKPTGAATGHQLIIGDLNSYASEDPIDFLTGNGFVNLAAEFLDDAYSYLFDGLLGTLDYALASTELFADIAGFIEAHLNADEADALDYNTDFARDPAYFSGSTPFRASDHDPVLVGINLKEPPVANYTLQILHQSDGEAGLLAPDTAPNLAALVDAFEDAYANTLILSGGDNFIPGPFGAAGTDPALNAVLGGPTAFFRPDIAIQNAIGVEVSAIGNHEFDLGSNVFNDAITAAGGFPGAQYALVTANLDFAADGALRGRADASLGGTAGNLAGSEASTVKGRIVPWTTVTEGGEKIGILGATTQVLERISSPTGAEVNGYPKAGEAGDGTTEVDNMDLLASQLQPIVNQMIASGINKIVLQSHLQDIENEKLLATKLSGVDVILSAGSNTRLGDAADVPVAFPGHDANFADTYPIARTGLDGKTTLIVNTDGEYTYLGRLVVEFDANGDIVPSSVNPAVSGAYAATAGNVAAAWGDADGDLSNSAFADGTKGDRVGDITRAVEAVISAKDGTFYGYTDVYLEGERSQVRSQETNLGDLTADANASVARTALGDGQPFVISLKNGGGIRAQIGAVSQNGGDPVKLPPVANPEAGKPAGAVSQLDIENALRFDNKLMVFDTTPAGLLAILDFAAGIPNNNGGFPQIGGLKYSYDEGAPAGSRVKSVALTDADGFVIAKVVENGQVVAGAPAVISAITLNFTANGGDGYPVKANAENFRYLLADGTLTPAVDESLDFTAPANVPANVLGEQTALVRYLQAEFATPGEAFDIAETPEALDQRIQNLDLRGDAVFAGTVVTGTEGDDPLVGTTGDDRIGGLGGNDTLSLNASTDGADLIDLGAGSDTITVAAPGQVRLTFTSAEVGNGSPNDSGTLPNQDGGLAVRLQAEDGADGLAGPATRTDDEGITFVAGAGVTFDVRDLPTGTPRGDQFGAVTLGTQGDDTLTAALAAASTYFNGGQGIDAITGGAADDFLVGGAGQDVLVGGAGNDVFLAGANYDRVVGGAGNDTIGTGDGDDTIDFDVLTDGADAINGEAGGDTVNVSAASATQVRLTFTSAEVGNGSAPDGGTLPNQDGGLAVRLQAENGADGLVGGVTRADDEGVSFVGGRGVTFDVRDLTTGAARGDRFQVVKLGTADGDVLRASDAGRIYYMNGGAGADTITGGRAGDFLVGGSGQDRLEGGAGDDTVLAGANNDRIIGGTGNDTGSGGAGDDTFDFNVSTDGADTINGEAGSDTVNLSRSGSAPVQVRLTFTSAEVGNGLANDGGTLANQDGGLAVRLQAEDASGALTGGVTRVDDEGVSFVGERGVTFDVRDLVSGTARGDAFQVVKLGTTDGDVLRTAEGGRAYYMNGGAGNDAVTGGRAGDFLVGGAGDDGLDGGGGSDSLLGGAGADAFVFATALDAARNVDTVLDFEAGVDKMRLAASAFVGLTAGLLSANAFKDVAGGASVDDSDRIIYDSATGALSFDRDGSGDDFNAIRFATLDNKAAVTAADFLVV